MPKETDRELLSAIGARLQQLRQQRGYSQEALSEAIEIQPTTLSRFETGKAGLSLTVLARAAEALGVRLGDIVDAQRPAPTTDRREAELLAAWRAIPEQNRELAVNLLREAGRWFRTDKKRSR